MDGVILRYRKIDTNKIMEGEGISLINWFIVLACPVIAIGVAIYSGIETDIDLIKKNWIQYRCNPVYMPFAQKFDADVSATDNFTYCMTSFSKVILEKALDPVYSIFDMMLKNVKSLAGTTNVVRNVLVKISTVIVSVIGSMFGRLFNTMNVMMMTMQKIRDITGRVTGSAWYTAFIVQTASSMILSVFDFVYSMVKTLITVLFAISLILSLFYPPILAFAITLGAGVGIAYTECFDPKTPIVLSTGEKIPIGSIRIGDVIRGNHRVTGKFVFNASNVELYSLDGISVSGFHKVYYGKSCIHVKDHPDAVPIENNLTEIICLITDTHKIPIKNHMFTDYEEDLSDEVMEKIEAMIYGVKIGQTCLPGFHGETTVLMKDYDKKIRDIKIGDVLLNGSVVKGVVEIDGSEIDWIRLNNGFPISGSQMMLDYEGNPALARDFGKPSPVEHKRAYSIILDGSDGWFDIEVNGEIITVRDYMETHDEAKFMKMEQIVLDSLTEKMQ